MLHFSISRVYRHTEGWNNESRTYICPPGCHRCCVWSVVRSPPSLSSPLRRHPLHHLQLRRISSAWRGWWRSLSEKEGFFFRNAATLNVLTSPAQIAVNKKIHMRLFREYDHVHSDTLAHLRERCSCRRSRLSAICPGFPSWTFPGFLSYTPRFSCPPPEKRFAGVGRRQRGGFVTFRIRGLLQAREQNTPRKKSLKPIKWISFHITFILNKHWITWL